MEASSAPRFARPTKLDRKVRKEARHLVTETRKALRAYSFKISAETRKLLEGKAEHLRDLVGDKESSGDEIRIELVSLDDLVDQHLAFARKSTGREYAESIIVAVLIALLLRAFVVEAFKIPSGSMIPTMEIGDHIFVNKFIYGVRIPYTTKRFFKWREPKRGEVIVFMNPCEPDKDFIKRVVAVEGDTVEVRCDLLYINGEAVDTHQRVFDDDAPCSYWDLDEYPSGETRWDRKPCSMYIEKHGGFTYSTIHGAERPNTDRKREANPDGPYTLLAGDRDFPGFTAPRCENEDPRPLKEQIASWGEIVETKSDGGVCSPQRHYVVPDGHVFVMGDNRDNSSDSRAWGSVPVDNIKGKAMFIWWSSQSGEAGGVQFQRMGKFVHEDVE
jgi:signal peptidase I